MFDQIFSLSLLLPSTRFQIDAKNILDGFSFDQLELSVDLGTFIGDTAATGLLGPDVSLNSVFEDLTGLLGNISSYGPSITAGDLPTELEGLFDKIDEAKEFAEGLHKFMAFVKEGE